MATTVEAIMGAVFLDRGEESMQVVMARLGLDHPLLNVVTSTSALLRKPSSSSVPYTVDVTLLGLFRCSLQFFKLAALS